MPQFSAISKFRLATCHPDLITIFNEVINHFDCIILEGYRNQADQEKAFQDKKTKLHYPFGKHNQKPSLAVDAAPVPLDWNNPLQFYYFAGFVKGIAKKLLENGKITHDIRYGGDFNMNNLVADESFRDLPHFELKDIK